MSKVPLCWCLLCIKGKQEGRKETLSQKELGWYSLKRIEVIVLSFSTKVCKPTTITQHSTMTHLTCQRHHSVAVSLEF